MARADWWEVGTDWHPDAWRHGPSGVEVLHAAGGYTVRRAGAELVTGLPWPDVVALLATSPPPVGVGTLR